MNFRRLLDILIVPVSAALWGPPAHAALSFTGVACSGQGTTMSSQAGYLSCSGAWSGNDLNQSADVASQILADWGFSALAPVDVTGGNSGAAGTLNFATQTGPFVISLKAGDAFSLFAFDGAAVPGGISSLAFDTLGVGFYSGPEVPHFGQDLSHATLLGTDAPIQAIPEPGTYAMLLAGGIAVIYLARRRRRP
jgi:hypothetical protein